MVDHTRILSELEMATCLVGLHGRKHQGRSRWVDLIVFRLACCCGLRVSEISRLRVKDVVLGGMPHLRVFGKGGKWRRVPLWWDGGTLEDMREFYDVRQSEVDMGSALVGRCGVVMDVGFVSRECLRRRFCRIVSSFVGRSSTIHDGRHTFCTHSLAHGRSLVEVMRAAGHSNVSITNAYLHLLQDDGEVRDIWRVA